MGRGSLAPFDEAVLAVVAAERNVPVTRVRALVVRHRERTREFPGVDELVYEWRTRLPYDPPVARADDAYYLAEGSHVWMDYGDQMTLTDEEVALLRAVHGRQIGRVVNAGEEAASESTAPMLLTRP